MDIVLRQSPGICWETLSIPRHREPLQRKLRWNATLFSVQRMLGYKVAQHGDTRVIITIEIPEEAITNLRRPGIAFAETAMYRANKVKVLQIEDAEGNSYPSAESFVSSKKLQYVVGEIVEEPNFDPRLEEIFTEGIHFFRNRRVAELSYFQEMKDGVFQRWHPNGQILEEYPFVDGQMHGLYQD
jgi:hypothetical protein